ncbi:tRNA pseudouridine(38-40) synthase TruA [Candidatus Poriferisodalis sp.]|uniref:tRNA pseudouridine(38-40) synthase TruA n=1 Tax=Candidatus Poriferisodalis sp. TaxID=3101277 RepID=UPI003D0BAAAC
MSEQRPALRSHERVIRLDLAYRGTSFRGFAENAGVRTVAGELTRALDLVLGQSGALTVAGRTDAGVHAVGQVVSFRTASPRIESGVDRLGVSLNRLLGPDIVVTSASVVPDAFDARRSASARAYEYRIRNAAFADPRFADLEWHIAAPLDVEAMNAAAAHFVGEHDFSSFCRRPKGRPDASLVRTVSAAQWHGDGELRRFEIEANAFCHQMVRALVGQCVAVGRGDRFAHDVPGVLAAASRDAAAPIAPPHGLTLVAVRYPG